MNLLKFAAAACVLSTVTGMAHAQLVDITQPNTTLASVLGHQFRVGDKLFTVPTNAFTSDVFNASQVFISPLTTGDPNVGVGFRLSGNFAAAVGSGVSDFQIAYTIEIAPEFVAQGLRFTGAGLAFNGSATGLGSFARVDETVLDGNNNNVLGNHSVFAVGAGGPTVLSDTFTSVRGYTRLNLVKDVQFFANGVNGTANASFVDQTFNQVAIPLPSTAALAFFGISGVALRRRR